MPYCYHYHWLLTVTVGSCEAVQNQYSEILKRTESEFPWLYRSLSAVTVIIIIKKRFDHIIHAVFTHLYLLRKFGKAQIRPALPQGEEAPCLHGES